MTVETFSANGTWTCPHFVTSVLVEATGPGGNGAVGGGGGGGGAYSAKTITVVPSTAYAYTCDAGADATFNTTSVVAKKGANGSTTNGGAGGSAAAGTGTTKYSGGAGGSLISVIGGGGGGAATADGNGHDGTDGDGTAGVGGNDGSDQETAKGGNGGASEDGGAPGGGGGGGDGLAYNGSGAVGRIRLTYTAATTGDGSSYLGLVNEPFVASDSLTVASAPASGFQIVITGWKIRCSTAAAPIAFKAGATTLLQDRTPAAGDFESAPGTIIKVPAATALTLAGGAATSVLNGHINYAVVPV